MSKAEYQASKILAPSVKSVVAIACTTAVTRIDLTTVPATTALAPITNTGPAGGSVPDPGQQNPIGKYIRISAQGGDVYFAFGSTYASLSALSATATTTVGAAGALTVAQTETDYIPAGGFKDIFVSEGTLLKPPPGGDSQTRFLGLLTASGTATARIYQASP